ncbi:MAG: hypothetical protein ND895_28690, partial [Pyrinomonadaceae bacterium]|nr:hypothetical protein [Pyrinomonadaceae bacterium]
RLLCKVINYLRLRHALLACRGFGRHSLVDTSDKTLIENANSHISHSGSKVSKKSLFLAELLKKSSS